MPGAKSVASFGYKFKWASTVKQEIVPWLWKGRIPLGCLTILDGDPGVGKTTIVLDLMARLSQGLPMPFEQQAAEPANSLVVSVEDSISYTIVPRLQEAGADMGRVAVLIDFPLLPSGLEKLKATVKETRAKLVMVDPGLAMFDSTINSAVDADTRRVVGGLAALAADCECAVVFVRHLNKTRDSQAMYRGGGSIAISAAARSCLLAKFPRGKSAKLPVLASYKSSLSLKPPTCAYEIVGNPNDPARVSHIRWVEEIAMTADEALEGDVEGGGGGGISDEEARRLRREGILRARLFSIITMIGEKGVSKAELRKSVGGSREAVDAALDQLVAEARIKLDEQESGKGRPKRIYRPGEGSPPEGPQEDFD